MNVLGEELITAVITVNKTDEEQLFVKKNTWHIPLLSDCSELERGHGNLFLKLLQMRG